MKVLVVDQDPKSARSVERGLREGGFSVDLVQDCLTALQRVQTSEYDLVVTEVTFPGSDGWELVRRLRDAGNLTPVFIVTSRSAVEDRVRGLELGADDYLVKPFKFSEFLARVRSILRRAPRKRAESIKVGDLEIDLLRRRVTRAGRRVELTPKEFALLSLLSRRAGAVVSHEELTEQVWDMNYTVESNTVAVHIKRLRAKIDRPFEHKLVRTVRGVGYMMNGR
jgi:two-component system copper resistance phosphate regulon response regulator CusR